MQAKRYTHALALAALAAAGLAAALTIRPPDAHAYSMGQLANMGFGILFISLPENGCHQWKIGWHSDTKTDLGNDCDPAFNDRLSAFVASHCPPYVCGGQTETVTTATTDEWTTAVTVTTPAPTPVTVETPAAPTRDDDAAPVPDADPSPPTAKFARTIDGTTVNVTDLSGAPSVTWSFGDGANGAGANVTHRYPKPGRYVIVETVIANGLAAQSAATVIMPASITPPSMAAAMAYVR